MKYIEKNIVIKFLRNFQCKRRGYIEVIESEELSRMQQLRVKELYESYEFDELFILSDSSKVLGIIMVFEFRDIQLYALDIWERNVLLCLEALDVKNSLIVRKNVLQKVLEGQVSLESVIRLEMDVLTRNYTNVNNVVTLKFLESFNIKLKYDKRINEHEILKYFSIYPSVLFNNEEDSDFQVICTDCEKKYELVYKTLNFIDYFFKMRLAYKPELVSTGSGYNFYKIANLIIGIQKFSNYADSDSVCYIINLHDRECRIFAKSNALQHGFRSCNALVAYFNQKEKGVNLHSSMLSYKGCGILIMGNKKAGKTTNMLYGLASDKEIAFCSNDYVHIKQKDGKWYGYGSWKKVTVRKGTVNLFPELRKMRGSRYDSKGNYLENSEKVCSVDKLVQAFKRKVSVSAPITVIILLKYSDSISTMSINKMNVTEINKEISKNLQPFFNGNEKFWNDILVDCTEQNHCEVIQDIDGYYVSIGSKNSFELWDELKRMIEDKCKS